MDDDVADKYATRTFRIMEMLVGKKIVSVRLVDMAFCTTFVLELDNGKTIHFEEDDGDILIFTGAQYDRVYKRFDLEEEE